MNIILGSFLLFALGPNVAEGVNIGGMYALGQMMGYSLVIIGLFDIFGINLGTYSKFFAPVLIGGPILVGILLWVGP